MCVSFHPPLPQDFEQWPMTGLHTYTGACRERGNTPDFPVGCSCWAETILRKITFMFFKTMTGSWVIYLPLRLPTNGTNVHDAADKIRWSELLIAKALIHFDILSVLWPHTRHETSGFPWPAHCWALALFWHMPSMNTQKMCVRNYVMLLKCLHFTWCFLSSPCDLRFSLTLPCRTVVRVAPFDSHWSCVHRTLRIWNDQLARCVQLHTSHRAHSLSSTTGGATGSKQSRFPPVTIKHLHCCPIIRVFSTAAPQ